MEVRITDLFDLGKIVDSGQCFRAALLPEGDYRFITGGQVLYIQKCAEETYRVSCDRESWERVWVPYFDLNRSYRDISGQIPEKDTFLRLAAQAGAGMATTHHWTRSFMVYSCQDFMKVRRARLTRFSLPASSPA